MKNLNFNSNKTVFIILFTYCVCCMLFLNTDSYLWTTTCHDDSSVYMMCGKALFNGQIPYLDFTDSKGILLWLIYGLGWWFTPSSYIGVFWISCIMYSAMLFIWYKTATLYVDESSSILASMLLFPILFLFKYGEMKTENYCMPFVSYAIYLLCSMQRNMSLKVYGYAGLGICLVCCLFLKWSIAVMMFSILFSCMLLSFRNKTFVRFCSGFGAGVIVCMLPFVTYFFLTGNIEDLVAEYFINTFNTVSVPLSQTVHIYISEIIGVFKGSSIVYVFIVLSTFILFCKERNVYALLPAMCACFFFAIAIHHDIGGHYKSIVKPFGIIAASYLVQRLRSRYVVLGCLCFIGLAFGSKISHNYEYFFLNPSSEYRHAYLEYKISQLEKTTIMYMTGCKQLALCKAIPACKDYFIQIGELKYKQEERVDNFKKIQPSVVVLRDIQTVDIAMVEKYGYKVIGEDKDGKNRLIYFSKSELKEPSEDCQVTCFDVLLKKNIIKGWK